ncbi:MAG: metal-dependent hydrolase [Candidatus Dasytiphilus stammeri]
MYEMTMTSRSHMIFGIAIAIAAKRFHWTSIITYGDWWHIIPSAMLTSLLPDIDHPRSLIGQRFKLLSYPIAHIFGHRGFTHSLLAVLVVGYLTFLITKIFPADVQYGMLIGYISHLTADFLTSAGIPLLWPFPWRFRLPLFHMLTGKTPERLLCIILLALVIVIPSDLVSKFSVINNHLLKRLYVLLY